MDEAQIAQTETMAEAGIKARAKARELVALILALPEHSQGYAWSEAFECFDEGLGLCYDCFQMNCSGYCRHDSWIE